MKHRFVDMKCIACNVVTQVQGRLEWCRDRSQRLKNDLLNIYFQVRHTFLLQISWVSLLTRKLNWINRNLDSKGGVTGDRWYWYRLHNLFNSLKWKFIIITIIITILANNYWAYSKHFTYMFHLILTVATCGRYFPYPNSTDEYMVNIDCIKTFTHINSLNPYYNLVVLFYRCLFFFF